MATANHTRKKGKERKRREAGLNKMDNPKFKVIIVGGSIAGLTLAHGLARQGIDFIVLEKRPEVAPQEGASIGIMPNGGRILDQLGIFGAIEEQIEPLDIAHLYWPDGFFFGTKAPRIVNERYASTLETLGLLLPSINFSG
ncbi:hypothetical protein EYZ11_010342 [Aspergillus tanneri]|uniref:FAD-binding domain-containing protein n=1 Tax=Aspergillus tanneri TaxID=1220188 RepID=A0A4S3J7Q5_9EURO|nr:hypothetical protein EYZ11_010342 [Aspergillus tanneri]